ncbi:MAG: hypothetical protein ACI4JB_10680 [Porcipelethomonas sp.]
MRRTANKLREHKEESRILETKADKIIFGISVAVYAVVMLLEFHLTPHHNTISSSLAALGVSVFLISKMIHVWKARPPVDAKDKLKFYAMPVVAAILIASAVYWLLKEYVF